MFCPFFAAKYKRMAKIDDEHIMELLSITRNDVPTLARFNTVL